MIERQILNAARFSLTQFRALCITGPRQSGKTTLSKRLLKGKPYVNFENPEVQRQAEDNPDKFLAQYKQGAIFDEVQRVPEIFRYMQEILDKSTKRGQFIFTGSNNFLLQEQISQSLAGRVGYLSLLPLSFAELTNAKLAYEDIGRHIITGGYPEIWQEGLQPDTWMNSYIQTYVQRDVRLLRNISNLAVFSRLISLCANYAGQIINRDELAKQTGVDTKTILAWLGLLESSYIIYQLQPWHSNLNKRIIKSPKLYFYDTGLLCSLLRIRSVTVLKKHHAYGAIFENWVITEIRKNGFNHSQTGGMYYFRDSTGNEIDLILEREDQPVAVEIKASVKVNAGMMRGLQYWKKYRPDNNGILIYAGVKADVNGPGIDIIPWKAITDL